MIRQRLYSRRLLLTIGLSMSVISGADSANVSIRVGTIPTALGECELWLPANYSADDAFYIQELVADLALVLTSRLGPTPLRPYQLIMVSDRSQFERWTERESPKWIQALAINRPSRLVLMVNKKGIEPQERVSLERTILHELTHAYLHRVGPENSPSHLPGWFHEGISVWLSGGFEGSMQKAVLYARWLGQLYDLDELSTIRHRSARSSEIAYGQSALAIEYLLQQYGELGLKELLTSLRTGEPFEFAIENVLNTPWPFFERDYQKWLRQRFDLLLVLSDPSVIFMLLPPLLIIAYFATLARSRRRKRQWAEAERLAAEKNRLKNIDLFID